MSRDLIRFRPASAHLAEAVRISELRIIGDFVLKGEPDMYVTFFEGLQQRPEQRHITGPLLQHTAKELVVKATSWLLEFSGKKASQ